MQKIFYFLAAFGFMYGSLLTLGFVENKFVACVACAVLMMLGLYIALRGMNLRR